MLEIIKIKNNFTSTFTKTKEAKSKAVGEYDNEKLRQINLVAFDQKITKVDKDKLKELKLNADKALQKETEIVNNEIYDNAFEWRFEFPEVLDKVGNYIGFDVVIGNPPYLRPRDLKINELNAYKRYQVFENQFDLYHLFSRKKGYDIINKHNNLSFIVPNTLPMKTTKN